MGHPPVPDVEDATSIKCPVSDRKIRCRRQGREDCPVYHRILKCHVLIELKVDEFRNEHLGQLNTYVTWYRRHMMAAGDNPPIGLLLCTQKDHALVE